ncbi:hypothetical protein [Mucilaginibacter sp. R-33]|uniref:hypothetical protein n=1 Tax=Mucilaginibacter sp. R-33 TaxID=3416711 RepID=UPI003CECE844
MDGIFHAKISDRHFVFRVYWVRMLKGEVHMIEKKIRSYFKVDGYISIIDYFNFCFSQVVMNIFSNVGVYLLTGNDTDQDII